MAPSFARLTPKLEFEFVPAAGLVDALRQTTAGPKIVATGQMLVSALRRRAVLPAQAAAELECGVLTEPRTAT